MMLAVECRLERTSRKDIHWRISVISEYKSGSLKTKRSLERRRDDKFFRNPQHRRMYLWVYQLKEYGVIFIYLYEKMHTHTHVYIYIYVYIYVYIRTYIYLLTHSMVQSPS